MHWEVGAVFLIWWCLIASAVAKCDLQLCGTQNVSYPLWIDDPSCGYPGFQIKCMEKENENGNSSKEFAPFLGALVNGADTDLEILHINYTGSLIINSTSLKAMSCNETDDASVLFELPANGPFTISSINKFVVIGCRSNGSFTLDDGQGYCESACLNQFDPKYCNAYGCCEAGIPGKHRTINFTGGGIKYKDFPGVCGFSTNLDPLTWDLPEHEFGQLARGHYGLLLQWGIDHGNCSIVKGTANYSCATEAECIDSPTGDAHTCKCFPGYEGTGYSNSTGCTDVDECSLGDLNQCVEPSAGGLCTDLPGSYNCSCTKDYTGDGFQNGTRCQPPSSNNSLIPAVIGFVSSLSGITFGVAASFWWLRRRQLKYAGDKNFIKNGGVELHERIVSMGGRKSLRMFSERELEIASNNYSIELGRGGFATVYKGVLSDGMHVAIKKPKALSPEFINEIVILSHINHRNVVKLIGCCLRTQLPLLVYEFVPNGTLFQHLQSSDKNFTWERRQQIAIETAEGVAYVHREASQPIFHRDIKSSNILLDDTFTPKVADFGISLLRPYDETHFSIMIPSGTPGYIDPEFVRSNQYTDKSDVYSFGVVLVELLTGLRPVLSVQGSMCPLYDHFLSTINGNRLREILDANVVKEENLEQMEKMARLAKACLQVNPKERPSMREVVEELAWIRAATKQTRPFGDVTLVEHSGDPKNERLNYNTLAATCPPVTVIALEDTSTPLIRIEMSDMFER
ncbi:wall-associated receptor kinase 2-like [Cryptomeria japonica]|uniref:wall-associated receptor kinase 2-like n=1 Tax=Cryptomeria japonica TaxID=3369 RepID=UPI0027DA1BF3|nr:wall-associated receptor kinase 2-like [Cryptomeria japonica]